MKYFAECLLFAIYYVIIVALYGVGEIATDFPLRVCRILRTIGIIYENIRGYNGRGWRDAVLAAVEKGYSQAVAQFEWKGRHGE